MGTWSEDIFGNDLACDVRDEYQERLGAGDSDAAALKRVRREFAEPMRDADARRTIWIALAATQHQADNVSDEVREQALKAIAWCETPDRDPERFPFGLDALVQLRELLGGKPLAPKKSPKPKVPPGVGGEVLAVTLPNDGGEAVIYVVGPAGNDRGDDAGRILLLFDVSPKSVTAKSVAKALLAWRHYEQDWGNGTPGRSIGCYDASGKLPPRRTRLLLKDVPMPPELQRRMRGYGAVYRSADMPWVLENDVSDWNRCDWKIRIEVDDA